MSGFALRLNELMQEKNISAKDLAEILGFSYTTMIYKWLRGEKNASVLTSVKICEYFECSLDYLYGRKNDYQFVQYSKDLLPFDLQFKKVLAQQNVSQYLLLQANVVSRGNLNNWFNKKHVPHIESVIKLADYLNVSMDYLVGREE